MITIWALVGRLREFKKPTVLTPLFIIGEVILECLIPLTMVSLVDALDGASLSPVMHLGLILTGLTFASLAYGILSARHAAIASVGLAKNLRQDLFSKVQDFSLASINRFSTSSLATRMTTDVTNVQNAFSILIRTAVQVSLMIVLSIVMAWRINVQMALIFLGMVPVLAIILAAIVLITFPILRHIFKKYNALNSSVQKNVAAIHVVKSFATEEHETAKSRAASQDVRKDFTSAEKLITLNSPVMMFFVFAAIIAVDYVSALIIVNSGGTELAREGLTALVTYGIQILSQILMLAFIFVMTTMAAESTSRTAEVLNHDPSLSSPANDATEVVDGSVVFKGVSSECSESVEKSALSDISPRIEPGSMLGIVGGTDSSKTSLIQLICRFYDVSEGSVRVDGRDVRGYDLNAVRDAVSVVLQKNVLFSGTVKDNMHQGNPDATDEQIEHACKLARADEFIQQLPGGYDYVISRDGANILGGQKQRLCTAQALPKNPMILILDDSTSVVDTKTDSLIRHTFESEIPDTMTITIAQRLSSVGHVSRIIVLGDDRIKERGTHEGLMVVGGEYHEIYDSQNATSESRVA